MNSYDWIIAKCNTAEDGVNIYRFRGTIEEAKEKLLELIETDRENDESNSWEHGSEKAGDIDAVDNGLGFELYGYGNYSDHHIDYTAKEFAHLDFI